MLFFLALFWNLSAHAMEVCTPINMNSGGRHSIELDCYEKQGFVDGSHVPATVSISVNGRSEFITRPQCDGTPCTLNMLRDAGRYASLRSAFPAGTQGTFTIDLFSLSNPSSVPLYRQSNDASTTYSLANPFSVKVPRMDVRTREVTYVDSRPDDPALADRNQRRTSVPPPANLERRVTPVAPAAPVAPATPAGTGGIVLRSDDGDSAPILASNCKYRDRVVDGKDAAPSIVTLPGCAQKICLAEARCDLGGRRRLVNVFCPAIGTENCPDATACANSEELGATFESLEVRVLAPAPGPSNAGER